MVEYKVLIVDDNPHFARSLYGAISSINYENRKYHIDIDMAESSTQAKELIFQANNGYDLAFLDTCMKYPDAIKHNFDMMRYQTKSEFYGPVLYQFLKEVNPLVKIFVVSRLAPEFSKVEFNHADAEYFLKTTTDVVRLANYVRNYFDTDRKRIMNNVFVVYGHNLTMKQKVNSYIKRIGLRSVDLFHESPGGITTIYNALERVGDDIDCAVVLLSGDDRVMNDRGQFESYRARQNVIFEMGLFAGTLGRDKVIVLYEPKNNFEFPSDIQGVFYIAYNNSNQWKKELKQAFEKIGFQFRI